MTFKPDPKPEVKILKGKAYHEFRKQVAYTAVWACEYCGCYAPFDSETQINGEVSHIRKRKAYGDIFSNVKWSCWKCHRKKHDANL
jgi:hypothetical protein